MAGSKQALIEEQYGKSLIEVLQECVDAGMTKKSAAEHLGVTKNTLLAWVKRHEIDWPKYAEERREKRKAALRHRACYFAEYDGITMPLFDAAAASGIPYNVLLDRFKKGHRGERLYRPVRSYTKAPEVMRLDLSLRDWEMVCELAEAIGNKAAAQRLNIPMSAVSRAVNGQIDRL